MIMVPYYSATSLMLSLLVGTLVTQAAESLRPPSVPLVTHDPYFSIWSPANKLTDADTVHWTGKPNRLCGMVRIDGKAYRLIGTEPAAVAALPQTGVEVLPTRTICTFDGAGIQLTLTFMTPALPDDLDVLSRPVTYLAFVARATDGATHEVAFYQDAAAEIAVNEPKQQVNCTQPAIAGLEVLGMASHEQPVLAKKGDNLRIDWGSFYLAAPKDAKNSSHILPAGVARDAFAAGGALPVIKTVMPVPAKDAPVAAVVLDAAKVAATPVSRWLMFAYDDEFSIRYFKQDLRPYWRRNGDDAAALLKKAAADYETLSLRCAAFDERLIADLRKVGGEKYAQLCVLAYRQTLAGNKICADAQGRPLMFPKENFSNGCIATVDVLFPQAPFFLVFSPVLTRAMLVPVLDYAASGLWPYGYAPHDLGTYPHATGQVYGMGSKDGDRMPVEESGNMLIIMASLARQQGNADLAKSYWPMLTKWADYLVKEGLDPQNQLCSADMFGHLPRNANLALKAIIGIGGFAQLCELTGKPDDAKKYLAIARNYAAKWQDLAKDDRHTRLAYDQAGSWSMKHNLIWDRVLGLNLIPEAIGDAEIAWYLKVQKKYGLPVDHRTDTCLIDWALWSIAPARNDADFQALLEPIWRYANETPTRVPLSDWFVTTDAKRKGFQARPVVGGVFIRMLAAPLMWKKWAGADAAKSNPQPAVENITIEGGTMDPLEACNVVWNSPSRNSSGSMPIGNGDIGMNVWVEENGDLLLLIGKTDAWDENSRIIKVGRVRITLSPSPFVKGQPFRQELKLRDGMIEIESKTQNQPFKILLWVDANRPVIRVECDGPQPFDVTAKAEVWRTEKRLFGDMEWVSCWHMKGVDQGNRPKEIECYLTPDTVVAGGERVVWYHRNEYSVWPIGMKLQGLESVMANLKDPLLNRTFGAAMCGNGFAKSDANTLKSGKPAKSHCVSIYPLTEQSPTPQAWLEQLDKTIQTADAVDLAKGRAEHQQWWRDFWNRSWIRISGGGDAETVTRGYTLQRWMSACAGRGNMAIKFNGSIFTVENRHGDNATSDPDWRAWGGDYWYQNTRLPYWPMLAAGDYDLMRPLFNMYFNTLELAKARNRIWFNCEGAYATETMSFWGLMSNGDYGWNRSGKQPSDMVNPYIRWIWSSGLDLSMMMLDYYEHTQDQRFLKEQLLPWTDAMVLHFDTRFKRDAAGKLIISPAQAVETYQDGVINPTTDIAALRVVLGRLVALPPALTDATARQRWTRFQQEIPGIPMTERDGRKYVLPAEKFQRRGNCENPELYTVFPFRIYGVGKPDLEIGRNTFAARIEKASHGWQQSSIQAAMLGLTDAARAMLVRNASSKHAGSRFPVFWGPNYDWIPDHCHGGNILSTTQTMLLQCEGEKMLLFPAWPKDWNVSFKLHAPSNTTVEGELRGGKVVSLKVTPQSRAADVVMMLEQ